MRIAHTELVLRVLVKFSREETTYLRNIGFLHPMCAEESEMHMTVEEYRELYNHPCFDKDELDREIAGAIGKHGATS